MKYGTGDYVEGARVRITTGPDHGLTGHIALNMGFIAGDMMILVCVKDEPIHRHRFAPVSWAVVLEEGEE